MIEIRKGKPGAFEAEAWELYLSGKVVDGAKTRKNERVKDKSNRNVVFFNVAIDSLNSLENLLHELTDYQEVRVNALERIKTIRISNMLEWLDPLSFGNYLEIHLIAGSDLSRRCGNCFFDNSIDDHFCQWCGSPDSLDREQIKSFGSIVKNPLCIQSKERLGDDKKSNAGFLLELTYSIESRVYDWKLPFSISEYKQKFKEVWELNWLTHFISGHSLVNFFSRQISRDVNVICCITGSAGFDYEVGYLNNYVKICHQEALNVLTRDAENSVIASFCFPETLKGPCGQYLWYFADFLKDLGINATSKINDEAGRILFSVTPNDDLEALDKIREALAVYLTLPTSPIIYDDSFAAMRLQQQIDNLQHSQKMAAREIRSAERELLLSQKVIESQDKIISQKDAIINQQEKIVEKILSKSIIIDALQDKEELEEICEGLKIGESDFLKKYFGVHLNPAKVVKTAGKNILGKSETTSILKSTEDPGEDVDK